MRIVFDTNVLIAALITAEDIFKPNAFEAYEKKQM
jgi:predicted nucleic acid-binding protein